MTWEDKLTILQELGNTNLCMRSPGDWYVSANTSLISGSFSVGCHGNGKTPQEAVEKHWELYSTLTRENEIFEAIRAKEGKYYKWSGYHWKDISYEFK